MDFVRDDTPLPEDGVIYSEDSYNHDVHTHKRLYRAIIIQAITDAISPNRGHFDSSRPYMIEAAKNEAYKFFNNPTKDTYEIFGGADLSSDKYLPLILNYIHRKREERTHLENNLYR